MKFLLHKSNQLALNSNLVEKFSIQHTHSARVEAHLADGGEKFTLKEFTSGNKDENLAAARNFLAQLVKNCGMKVIFYNEG